jgi:SAM-dependent methyltransferase
VHPSVMAWVEHRVVTIDLEGLDVLEVGSYDVNGSVRPLFDGCRSYFGIDKRPGPGVDLVADIEWNLLDHVYPNSWDIVVCCEMLEHTPHPADAANGILRAMHPGSHLILTTRSEGFPIHEHPEDYGIRFTAEDLLELFGTVEPIELVPDPDPNSPGVFFHGQRI